MSTNNKGSWSDTKIAYDFIINAPFYQTASFIVGMFVLVGGLVTLILYLRVKQRVNRIVMLERIRQKEQENLRKEIARDFHDEMGNQLTRIINYVSLLKLNGNGVVMGIPMGIATGMTCIPKWKTLLNTFTLEPVILFGL